MPRIRPIVPLIAVWTVSLGSLLTAQVMGGTTQIPPRDGVQLPTERRIPVGTSTISGTVVAADTGRPVTGARVIVSGTVTANMAVSAAQAAGRSGVPGGIATPPTRGGGAPSTVMLNGQTIVQMPNASSATSLSRTALTDATGSFSFPRLPAGQFTVSTSQAQFMAVVYGQTRPGGQGKIMVLADGQHITLNVSLPRGGVITGTVIGAEGDPQRSAQVRSWRVDISSGFKRLVSTSSAQSDDRGIYRIFGLPPGEYFVSATPSPGELLIAAQLSAQTDLVERAIATAPVIPPAAAGMTPTVAVPIPSPPTGNQLLGSQPYLPTYAPSSMAPSGATSVTVAAGEERIGIDVRLQMAQATNIQGVVTTPLETGVTLQLWLVSDDLTIDSPQAMSARSDAAGTFIFRGVAPGSYTVVGQTTPAQPTFTIVNGQATSPSLPPPALTDAQKMWGRARVTVAGEPTIGVSLTLKPGRSISGVVAFDMARPPDLTRTRVLVSVSPAPSPQPNLGGPLTQVQVSPDGRFTMTGVMPGRYSLRATTGLAKSAVVSGVDTLDFPLDFSGDRDVTDAVITVTDQFSELSGSLMDTAGQPAVGYTILAVATDSRYWMPGSRRIAQGRPGPDGKYSFRGLPAGTYQLAAVVDLVQGEQYDPEFLRTLARASVPVTITDGGKVTQDLRVK